MKVIYEPTAFEQRQKLPLADRAALDRKLARYAETGEGDVTKLVGSDCFRLRHGDWRAVFEIQADLIVVRIAHRREVYR